MRSTASSDIPTGERLRRTAIDRGIEASSEGEWRAAGSVSAVRHGTDAPRGAKR